MQTFIIQEFTQEDDWIGGTIEKWTVFKIVKGYMDLVTGSDITTLQNAFVEDSSHILIIPEYTKGITDDMRIISDDERIYSITYADNPVGVNHHNELYCKYGGVYDGQ